MRFKQYLAVSGVALGLLTISACGSSSDHESPAPSSMAAAVSASPRTTVVPTDITAPDTKLKIGQRAVVRWQDGYIGITVTAVEPGDLSTFRQKFGANAEGLQPYYVHLTLENVGGTDLSTKNPPEVRAARADGSGTGTFIVGSVDACQSTLTPKTFTTVGAKYDTCQLDAADTGDQVTGAQYAEGDYDDHPLLWMK